MYNEYLIYFRKVRFMEPVVQFRTSLHYNDIMYGLIAFISEKLGNKPWEELVKEKLFVPLGMTSSTFVNNPDIDQLDAQTIYMADGDHLGEVSWELLR